MNRALIITLLIVCQMALRTHAQTTNPANIDKVLAQLKIKREDCYNDLAVEKVIPFSPGKSVIVIPRITEKTESSFSCDSYILVIDNHTGTIMNKFFEPNAWTSDAVRISHIDLDFAPYKLNPTTRAFGIRVLYEGSSRPNPYENEELSLFIIKDRMLKRVLKNFSISRITGEWDTRCEGQFITEKKALVISGKATHNYKNIVVKNKITTTSKKLVNDDCVDENTSEFKTSILRYDSKEYK